MATSVNITYRKLYTIGKSKLCWLQMCANGVGRQSGREDMSKTKMALNPRLRLEVFHVTVKRPSKVGQRKVRSLVRNRNKQWIICYFLFSKHCIFAITQWFSYQYMAYYISLESYEYPLLNGILSQAWILSIHLLFIIYSIIFVLKYLDYFQYNYHCIKVWDVLENHCYPPITPTHFLEWISLQYYDITIRIMWVHSNLPWLLTL